MTSGSRAPAALEGRVAGGKGSIDFLGRSTPAVALAQSGRALAAGLAAAPPRGPGLRAGDRVAVLLPNSPAHIELLLAAERLGLRLLVLDPRVDETELAEQLSAKPPQLLVTSNPAPLFDKVLRLMRACPADMPVAVERFTDLLPFPRNLIAPLLRGGGLATLPPDARFLRYASLKRHEPLGERASGLLVLEGLVREWSAGELVRARRATPTAKRQGERWLLTEPLSDARRLAAVLRGLETGARVLLSPRLDRKSLAKVAEQAASEREIP